eukprot:gene10571-biopygen10245
MTNAPAPRPALRTVTNAPEPPDHDQRSITEDRTGRSLGADSELGGMRTPSVCSPQSPAAGAALSGPAGGTLGQGWMIPRTQWIVGGPAASRKAHVHPDPVRPDGFVSPEKCMNRRDANSSPSPIHTRGCNCSAAGTDSRSHAFDAPRLLLYWSIDVCPLVARPSVQRAATVGRPSRRWGWRDRGSGGGRGGGRGGGHGGGAPSVVPVVDEAGDLVLRRLQLPLQLRVLLSEHLPLPPLRLLRAAQLLLSVGHGSERWAWI